MSTFHQSSPRPPLVPGEEIGVITPNCSIDKIKLQNPPLTPRTSSLYRNPINVDGNNAPLGLGFELERKCESDEVEEIASSPSLPAYLLWARNLSWLLSDPEGVTLFRSYLIQEGRQHADPLDFWFACEGLRKQTDPEHIARLVKVIYRSFFLKTQLGIKESLRKAVHKRVKDSSKPLDSNVFDSAQNEVERLITETTYPNFLRSEIYLNFVQSMQNGSLSSNSISGGGSGGSNQATLATLHEDKELDISSSHQLSSHYPPLTKDMLIMTQKRRVDLRPNQEAFASVFLHGKPGIKAYSSYNPVSRQDSELQSLSSDARTESDTLSLTDTSIDGTSRGNQIIRRQYQRHYQQVKEAAKLNMDPEMHQTVIPRTHRIQTEQVHPMKPDDFAAILIDKLEAVKRNQEAREKLAYKLLEGDGMEGSVPAKSLAEAIRERLQIEDDNDQDILDQHVSRVWSDQTPAKTPGIASPRPKSPDILRRGRLPNQAMSKVCMGGAMGPHMNMSHSVPHPYQARPYPRPVRKEKDVFSTFSSDSGNVHDMESLDLKPHIPKSKSVPDYSDSTTDLYSSLSSHDARFRQSRGDWCTSSRRYNKKPELTDSGVSVVSETVSHHGGGFQSKERVLSWLKENEIRSCCSHSDCSCSASSSRFESKHRSNATTSQRGRRSPPMQGGPCQSYIGNSSMPPLQSQHTSTQLEEARRRLEDQARMSKQQPRQRFQVGKMENCLSGGSTLRRKQNEGYTTVVYSFCDEQFPYRTKIFGHSITLKQFKEILHKKGNYRCFFKTECDELDMKVIQEEITDDSEILPLWEGKIMAQVKSVD